MQGKSPLGEEGTDGLVAYRVLAPSIALFRARAKGEEECVGVAIEGETSMPGGGAEGAHGLCAPQQHKVETIVRV